jgi:three-Cys-motif partner protein
VSENHEYFTGQNRPQTAKKLSILRKYFAVWLTIWSGDQCANWVGRDWYVLDLFAGTGRAQGVGGETLSGSPLVFLEEIREHADRLRTGVTIHVCVSSRMLVGSRS